MALLKTLIKSVSKVCVSCVLGEVARGFLNKIIKRQIINNSILLLIFLIAVLISYIKLFGKDISLFITAVIVLGIMVYSIVRFIIFFIRQIPLIISFPIEVFKAKSLTEAICIYVYKKYAWIFKLRDLFYRIFNGFFKDSLPEPKDLVDYIWGYLGKQLIIFIVSLGLYLLIFTLFVKPLLQFTCTGISGIKIYFVPFAMAIDYFFKTNLMALLIK